MSILDNYKISYAQNREDVIIEAFFPDIKKGFYVDVGANDPEDDSVTKIFYDRGWQGINIEPSPRLFEKLTKARKRDINIKVGIAQKEGQLRFREYKNHGLSTFSDEMKKGYEKRLNENTAVYNEYVVKVKPLSEVLEGVAPKHIHFLKVDVEGFEYEVLASNKWDVCRPELICIEANHIIRDWHSILKKANYELVFEDGLNEYFLASECIGRKKLFNYAESIILGKQIITPGLAKHLARYERLQSLELEAKLQKYVSEIKQLEFKNISIQTQLNKLRVEIDASKDLRKQAKELYLELDSFVMRSIERRAYSQNPNARKTAAIDTTKLERLNTKELLNMAKTYDAKAYFRFRSPKNGMKLRYRVVGKTYRTSRDLSKKIAVKGYRLVKKAMG